MPRRTLLPIFLLLAACGPSTGPTEPPPSTAAVPDAEPGVEAPSATKACAAASLPKTPVGERATALLDVVKHGDPKAIEALVTDAFSPPFQSLAPMEVHVGELRGLHDQTGALTACRIDYASPTEAIVLLAAERGEEIHVLTITVEEAAPHRVTGLEIWPASADTLEQSPTSFDDAARHQLVEGVATALDGYVYADVAAAMQARIRAERDAGRYAALAHPWPLARQLTKDLRDVSKDKHLSIHYSAQVLPPKGPEDQAPTPEELEAMRAHAAKEGFGIAKVEVLDGDIGYVDLRGFHPVDLVRDGLAEAMTKVADTKALVVDLRHNGGGDPATVAFVSSYLFGDKKVHLNDLYERRTNETKEYWTDPKVPGKRFGDKKPIYVLTSSQTFSAAEEFAYNLRSRKRATIVGETTGGGAHPVDGIRVDDHVLAVIPIARAVNPVTKTNWEGKGVEPHVAVPASEALERAKALIAGGK